MHHKPHHYFSDYRVRVIVLHNFKKRGNVSFYWLNARRFPNIVVIVNSDGKCTVDLKRVI